jgi:CRP-like cAMP-binding protein
MAVCGMISRRLRLTHQRRLDFHNYQVGVRLARVLVELAEMCGRPVAGGIGFDFGLPQRDLAALVDADVDTVGKELRKLRDQGMIHNSYRKIIICDLATLKEIACLPSQGPHDGL